MSEKIELKHILNSINSTKQLVFTEDNENQYPPYVVNRAMSFHVDTVLYANELNSMHQLPKMLQYHYYMTAIKKGKRFSKWHRPKKDKYIELIMEYYNCNIKRAKEYYSLLQEEQLIEIEEYLNKGGVK